MSSRVDGDLIPPLPSPPPQGGREAQLEPDCPRPVDGGAPSALRRLRGWGWPRCRDYHRKPNLSRRRWLTSAVAGLVVGGLAAIAPALGFDRSELTIAAAGGKQHHFRIELARNPDDRARGLMYRRTLDADAGMLFDFETPQLVSMWMMNTLIPLDMLFIAADGRIATIAERTVPHSTASILSEVPVRGVLELNGGTVARLGIKRGDRVVHPIFEGR